MCLLRGEEPAGAEDQCSSSCKRHGRELHGQRDPGQSFLSALLREQTERFRESCQSTAGTEHDVEYRVPRSLSKGERTAAYVFDRL